MDTLTRLAAHAEARDLAATRAAELATALQTARDAVAAEREAIAREVASAISEGLPRPVIASHAKVALSRTYQLAPVPDERALAVT